MKTIIGKDKSSLITTFSINDTIVTDSRDIENGSNNYFIYIGPLLANDIECRVNPLSYVKSIHSSIVIVNMSCSEVGRVISSLKNSSAWRDEIPTCIIVILNP